MAGRITPGPSTNTLNDNFSASFVLAADGQPALATVNTDGSAISGGTGSITANLYTGQQTVNTTQVKITSGAHALLNGIVVKAPSTNAANIYVGPTGVTTSTGDILEPGEARGYAVNNTNLLYIISVASTTDKVSYSAN